MTTLNIAIAAEFELCEKLSEHLAQSDLNIHKLAIVEIIPFNEEQGVRFNNKAVAQLTTEEVDWSDVDYLLFAGRKRPFTDQKTCQCKYGSCHSLKSDHLMKQRNGH